MEENFKIELDDQKEFYKPGESIKGAVKIIVLEAFAIEGLELHCIGGGIVRFVGAHGETHMNEETYFEYRAQLDQKQDGSKIRSLQYGYHKFPFQFELPQGIPSSYKSRKGSIQHWCEAKMGRPGKHDLICVLQIPVWRPSDLNDYPRALKPENAKKKKFLCCFCLKSGPLGFNVNVNKTGFVVGENIEMKTELFNYSSRTNPEVVVTILESVKLEASDRKVTWGHYGKVLGKLRLPGVEPGQHIKVDASLAVIPNNLRPLNLIGCSFMKVMRSLKIEMIVQRSSNLKVNIPIVIGTIAFRNVDIVKIPSTVPPVVAMPVEKPHDLPPKRKRGKSAIKA